MTAKVPLTPKLEMEGAGAAGGGPLVLQQTHPTGVTRVLVSPGLHDVTLMWFTVISEN